tara:strand:+ start:4859 stop:7810 length:2952 start_codon:yes stop_codon:yes gene_type:complete
MVNFSPESFDSADNSLQGLGVLIGSSVYVNLGCTDPQALNYNPQATSDDGSCCNTAGCMDSNASNYNVNACVDDGTCQYVFLGCTNPTFVEYDPNANTDDGSCNTPLTYGCTDNSTYTFGNTTYNTFTNAGYYSAPCDGVNGPACDQNGINCCCIPTVLGCTNAGAVNYDPNANTDDGSCAFGVLGCTDPNADNYDPSATINDSCQYTPGCMDPNAFNYNPAASIECNGVDYDGQPPCVPNQAGVVQTGLNCCCHPILLGCMNPAFCNFDPLANTPDTCSNDSCTGCTDPAADNYLPNAIVDDGSCCYGTGCNNANACNYDPSTCAGGFCIYMGCMDATANNFDAAANTPCDGSCGEPCQPNKSGPDCCCTYDVYGCTDPTAFNYDSAANVDDGSCVPFIDGCTDATACNYNPAANTDDGNCEYDSCLGCTDPTATNYDPTATQDDGSCDYCVYGCTDNTYLEYNGSATCEADASNPGTGICNILIAYGCTDPTASNHDASANTDDNTCTYPSLGCTDPTATNYDAAATVDDGSCIIYGCTDPTAQNYNEDATVDDGSCCLAYGCTNPSADNYNSMAGLCDDGSCFVYGCSDSTAVNYDDAPIIAGLSITDDGSCIFAGDFIATTSCNNVACMATLSWPWADASKVRWNVVPDQYPSGWDYQNNNITSPHDTVVLGNANNPYVLQPNKTFEWEVVIQGTPWNSGGQPVHGTHTFTTGSILVSGCTDSTALNYDALAVYDDGSCTYDVYGCTDPAASNYYPSATIDNGNCLYPTYGCTDPTAANYDPAADTDDGGCVFLTGGCLNNTASSNYDSTADFDDGSCIIPSILPADVLGVVGNIPGNNSVLVVDASKWNDFANYVSVSNPSITDLANITTDLGADGEMLDVTTLDDGSITGMGLFRVQPAGPEQDVHPNPTSYWASSANGVVANMNMGGQTPLELYSGSTTPIPGIIFIVAFDATTNGMLTNWPDPSELTMVLHNDSL